MPIHAHEMYGTGQDGIEIEDYCIYCYKDGQFTQDVTMDEMIRLCSNYVSGNSRDVAIVSMKMLLPRLKRWAQKEETQHEYHKAINRVLEYIQGHLGENTDLKTLAAIANLSTFHFHRIFKTTIGESLGEYVQRLRLEYVAEQLKTSKFNLSELAIQTGYSSEQALSRAFKKYFSIPPSIFKTSFFKDKFKGEIVPRICKVTEKNGIMFRTDKPDNTNWNRLYMYAMVNHLLSESCESVDIIKEDTFYPCLILRQKTASDEHIETITLQEGLYAIFTHKGNTEGIKELLNATLNYWLSSGKYILSPSGLPYIKYLNNPLLVPEAELISEIYIPVTKK